MLSIYAHQTELSLRC